MQPADQQIPPFMRPGQLLTNYSSIAVRVQRVLGGGMGLVAIGYCSLGKKDRAMKMIRPELLDERARQRFLTEALTWVGVWPHANIMLAQFVTEIAGIPFLVLDYAEHGNLRDALRQPLSIPQALRYAQHIAAGLLFLHTPDPAHLRPHPIVHRDLKPENILLRELFGMRFAQITDLGLAKALAAGDEAELAGLPAPRDATATGTLRTQAGIGLGTPAYMPPEQWASARDVGTAADVYALACILGELFTGQHPILPLHQPHSTLDWLAAHEAGKRAPLPGQLAPELLDAYEAALEPDPRQRPTAGEVLAALRTAAARRPDAEVYTPPEVIPPTPENQVTFWQGWGDAYFRFQRYGEAWVRVRRARRLAPHDPKALVSQGNILTGQAKQQEQRGASERARGLRGAARAAFDAALKELPVSDRQGHMVVWNSIGVIHSEAREWAEAERAYEASLALMPEAADTWANRASNEQLWALEVARDGKRTAAEAHLALAEQYIQQSITLEPHQGIYQRMLAAIQQAQARVRRG